MPEATSAQDVIERFRVSRPAQDALARWERERPEVAAHVLAHTTRTPYRTSLAELAKVAKDTEHALGDVHKSEVKDVVAIRDWNPDFAMTHVLHYALESLGEPFTYQRFRSFCRDDPRARTMLWEPAERAVADAASTWGEKAQAAMRWRIGNSYYSFMRELVTVVALRERGLDLEIHPLADALFRVDAWTGTTVVALYIGNASFRDGEAGRKTYPAALLGPSFRYAVINLRTQHEFGRLHVPSEEALDKAAAQIREVLAG